MFADIKTVAIVLAAEACLVSAGVAPLAAMSNLAPRWGSCNAFPGAVNGQCSTWYQSNDCSGNSIGNEKADCDHTCRTVEQGFRSIKSQGDGTFGNACSGFTGKSCEPETKVMNGANSVFASGDCGVPAQIDGQDQVMYSYMCLFKC